ncbi:MAG: choice-of-anchor B family protein [Bacteroidetes bacterium]|nr:choice-of-anchor B family protein [Bacteroidota bacterium]
MNLLDRWDDDSLPLRYGAAYSDIWGYVDPSGNEYALVATIQGIHIFDVSNNDGMGTAYPVLIDFIQGGSNSLWRDIKTYQNYAYAVADEGGEGLLVIDLSNLPASASLAAQVQTSFTRSHNIFIDEAAARLYAVGTNTHSQGIIVMDLSNPANPVEISDVNLPAGYVHDVFVRGDTAYCSHGSDGLYVYDYSVATSPTLLGSLTSYPESGYNHSSWLNADGTQLVFADETHGKALKIADVSNLGAISVSTSNLFESTLEAPAATNSIAHNPFIKGDSVYISYYHDGVQVFNIEDPDNVFNVAYFDTEPNNTNYAGFEGCWGVYPFLPSGNIIASDQLRGLFVLEVTSSSVPVELTDLQGHTDNSDNILHWQTATESNTAYFEIQRSQDGETFESIGKVQAAGESNIRKDYQFTDENPFMGNNYYRLKIMDLDGSFEYTQLVHLLQRAYTGDVIRLYPNIISGARQVVLDHDIAPDQKTKLKIRLLNSNGQPIFGSISFSDLGQSLYLNIPDLSSGIYFLEIKGPQTASIQRITVSK